MTDFGNPPPCDWCGSRDVETVPDGPYWLHRCRAPRCAHEWIGGVRKDGARLVDLRFAVEDPEEWSLRHIGHDVRLWHVTDPARSGEVSVTMAVRQCCTCNQVYMGPLMPSPKPTPPPQPHA